MNDMGAEFPFEVPESPRLYMLIKVERPSVMSIFLIIGSFASY